jgi:hypothetical protein
MSRASERLSPIIVAGTVIAAGVFLVAYARIWHFLTDDVFISLRYAQNLVAGHGLVYNPGERVEGYTNFLWTLFLAVPFLLHLPPTLFVKLSLAALTLATGYFIVRLGRASGLLAGEGRAPWLAWVPAWLFLASPVMIHRAADGLETIPFTFLLVLATTLFFEETCRSGATRVQSGTTRSAAAPARATGRSGAVFAALALMRPDGVAFAPLLLAIAALRRVDRRDLIRFALLALGPVALYFVCRWAYYGQLLPNTLYAKGGGDPRLMMRGLDDVLEFLRATGGYVWIAILPALFAPRTRAAAWMLLAIVLARTAFDVWSGGAWTSGFRFLIPALPFLLVLGVAGVATLIADRRELAFGLAVAGALILTPGWLDYPVLESLEREYGRGLFDAQGAFGRAVNERTARDAVIAMDDAGLGPFLAQRRNIDMLGLNDPHIAHLPGYFASKFDVPYVLGLRPDLIVLVSKLGQPAAPSDFSLPGHAALFFSPEFRARYEYRREYAMRADYHLLVYRRRDSRAVPAGF